METQINSIDYRPYSLAQQGDNALGSIRLSVQMSFCVLLLEPDKHADTQMDGRTLPSALSPCFAKAIQSIKRALRNVQIDK